MNAGPQVRRPLVACAVCVAIGLTLPPHPLLALGLCAVVLAWGCLLRRHAALYLACGLLAASYAAVESMQQPQALVLAETVEPSQTVLARVISEPFRSGDTTVFRVQAKAVQLDNNWMSSAAGINVYLQAFASPVEYGQMWKLTGRFHSYEQGRNGCIGSFSVDEDRAVLLKNSGYSLTGNVYRWRKAAAGILDRSIPDFSGKSLLQALMLGYRQAMPQELYEMFSRTGTLHIFAISGLHVGVMASLLIALLQALGVPRPMWGLLLIPALLVYVAGTGLRASSLRAFTMASVYFSAPLLRRRPDIPSSISIAAIILLAICPSQIHDAGFLLSFTVVAGIVLMHSAVSNGIRGTRQTNWLMPLLHADSAGPLKPVGRTVGLLLLTSVSAWLFSFPLAAHFFNTLSPAALLANLLIIPLTFMIVLSGGLTLFAGAVSWPVASIFGHASRAFVFLLIQGVSLVDKLPFAWRFVRSPSAAAIMLWYSGLILMCISRRRALAASLLVISTAVWFAGDVFISDRPVLRAQGPAHTLLTLPDQRNILVTTGDVFQEGQTIRALKREGINELYALVLTGSATPEGVAGLQKIFKPRSLVSATNAVCWPVGSGRICVRNTALSGLPEKP